MTQSLDSELVLVSEPASAPVPVGPPAAFPGSAADTGAEPAAAESAESAAESAAGLGESGSGEAGSGPALADLVAAGLVSHELIGDPARLGAEVATLRRLCAHVSGSIWRIEPYHYAFRLTGPDDETNDGTDPETAGAALAARLAAEFGPDAVWVSPTDLIAETDSDSGGATDPSADPAADTGADMGPDTGSDMGSNMAAAIDLDAPLLLLRASAGAVADGIDFAGPGVQAVVSASFAARAARIAADRLDADRIESARIEMARIEMARIEDRAERLEGPDLAQRFAALEAGQARIEAALATEAESRAAAAAAEVRLTELFAKVLCRLDAQADVLHGHIAREDQVATRLGEIAALAESRDAAARVASMTASVADDAAGAAFREALGLTLAEFLARLERREAALAVGARAAGELRG